jgi:hypothetical protein
VGEGGEFYKPLMTVIYGAKLLCWLVKTVNYAQKLFIKLAYGVTYHFFIHDRLNDLHEVKDSLHVILIRVI